MRGYDGFSATVSGDGEKLVIIFLCKNTGIAKPALAGNAGNSFSCGFQKRDKLADRPGCKPGLIGYSKKTGVWMCVKEISESATEQTHHWEKTRDRD